MWTDGGEDHKGAAHIEVLEEVNDESIWDDERNEDKGHVASKQKSTTQSITKLPSLVGLKDEVAQLALLVKQKIKDTELKSPLDILGEDLLLAYEWNIKGQV